MLQDLFLTVTWTWICWVDVPGRGLVPICTSFDIALDTRLIVGASAYLGYCYPLEQKVQRTQSVHTDINTGTPLGGLASLCVEDEAGALVRVLDKSDA